MGYTLLVMNLKFVLSFITFRVSSSIHSSHVSKIMLQAASYMLCVVHVITMFLWVIQTKIFMNVQVEQPCTTDLVLSSCIKLFAGRKWLAWGYSCSLMLDSHSRVLYEVEKEVPYRKPHSDKNVESMFWSHIHFSCLHKHTRAFIIHEVIWYLMI